MRKELIATAASVAFHLLLATSVWIVWQHHQPEITVNRMLPLRLTHLASAGGDMAAAQQPATAPAPEESSSQEKSKPVPKQRPQTKPAPPEKQTKPKPHKPKPQKRVHKPEPHPRPVEPPPPEPQQIVTEEAAATPTTSAPPPVAPAPIIEPAAAQISGRSGGEAAIADFRAALQQGIERNKRYPQRERRRRHEGRSVIAFTLHRNGSISDIRIVTSSGYPRLDRAAMAAVKKIDGEFPIPPALKKEEWSFTVPIIYRLQ